jgi:hypothetical protein
MKKIKNMKIASVFVLSVFLASFTFAGEKSKSVSQCGSRIPVFVKAKTDEGFTPERQVADSTKDLIDHLKDQKKVCLIENQSDAKIVLQVLGRQKANVTMTWAGSGRDCTVAAKMTVGTYETIIEQSAAGGTMMSGGAWGKAAGKVAKKVEQFIDDNYDKLKQTQDQVQTQTQQQ